MIPKLIIGKNIGSNKPISKEEILRKKVEELAKKADDLQQGIEELKNLL